MRDYIDRQAVSEAIAKLCIEIDQWKDASHFWQGTGAGQAKEIVDDFPAADVVERKTGKWEYDSNGMDWGIGAWVCSECGGKNDMIPVVVRGIDGHEQKVNPYRWAGSKFCPNCGARMEDK